MGACSFTPYLKMLMKRLDQHNMAHTITISAVETALTMVLLLKLSSLAAGAAAPTAPIGMPGCDTTCGDVDVQYPFGMGPERCYHSPVFNLTCDRTSNPPRLLLAGDGTLRVDRIDPDVILRVIRTGNIETDADGHGTFGGGFTDDGPFLLAPDPNELIVTGCNVQATLKSGNVTIASCSSLCKDTLWSGGRVTRRGRGVVRSRLDTSMLCTGEGCCQADIIVNREEVAGEPVYSTSYDVELKWFGWNRTADKEWPARVFIAGKGWFGQTWVSTELLYTNSHPSKDAMEIPVWLNFVIARNYSQCTTLCKSKHSNCTDNSYVGIRGYRCYCEQGYQGNPYVTDGCQDIDECELYKGKKCYGECINTDGSYVCQAFPSGSVTFDTATTGSSCNRSCGDVAVPYPFGINPGCYFPGFNLTCDTSHNPPRLLLGNDMSLRVVDISLHNNILRVLRTGALVSTARNTLFTSFLFSSIINNWDNVGSPFSLSTRNELILTGCNVKARLEGRGNPDIISGCASFCSNKDVKNYTRFGNDNDHYCHGIGCCQARISASMDGMPYVLLFQWIDRNGARDTKSIPGNALVAEEGWFDPHQFFTGKLGHNMHQEEIPILLQWEILQPESNVRDVVLVNEQKYHNCSALNPASTLCKSKHSYCRPGNRGYSCHCSDGYSGSPYLLDGCTGGGRKSFKGKSVVIGIASGAGFILLVLVAFFISIKLKRQRAQRLKQKFFHQNRGQLLRQLVSQRTDIAERMIISLEELEKATNNFDKTRELGGGGHGTVYKGILSNLHVVAIKKPKMVVQKEIDEFINEVAILSQINHRNVVKLYGCCLKTQVPMLVYEFISNGTLHDHLHVERQKSLSWEDRLRIATETAKSLAYLHSTALIPIIHRDIKSANILLDDTLTTKVADFGASRYISLEKSGLTTMVQGTIGYLDPVYFTTGRLTEKSDVYSYGVILIELMTREKPFSYISSEGKGLAAHFSALFAEGNLSQILDPQVMVEGDKKVEEVAALAVACVQPSRGEDRPTMRKVELMLGVMQSLDKHALPNGGAINCKLTINERNNGEPSGQYTIED